MLLVIEKYSKKSRQYKIAFLLVQSTYFSVLLKPVEFGVGLNVQAIQVLMKQLKFAKVNKFQSIVHNDMNCAIDTRFSQLYNNVDEVLPKLSKLKCLDDLHIYNH